ncbi:MurR/RpiR family transcriptional regulator [Xenophilus sp. Marseille-Q4582]|uniref:MurR/RpiR family transcriptional regulator n=1 Tax=Xenophilus sp. Marseille-Q4582 TaxID=2866600 RepID=UPI001CE3C443|nr:MurR/RpiR family transcriptional regulator [Xenophilus sp. Marseille-Q4582]
MTQLEKRVAHYLLSNPDAILTQTSNTIAKQAFVSPMTVSRFFRKLGFHSGPAARQAVAQQLASRMPAAIDSRFDRYQRHRGQLESESDVKMAVGCVQRAAEFRRSPQWAEIVQLAAHADSVFAVGLQSMGYLATGLVGRLGYIRPNVHDLDGADGVYAPFFADTSAKRLLIVIDIFRYGRNGPVLCQAARDSGADVVVFCDEHGSWARDITPHVVSLPSESGYFFRSTVAIHLCLHMLVQDVIDVLGEPVRQQLERMSEAQALFGQYLD